MLQFCLNYAIFDELCEKLRLEVNYAKSQHRRILEALANTQYHCLPGFGKNVCHNPDKRLGLTL